MKASLSLFFKNTLNKNSLVKQFNCNLLFKHISFSNFCERYNNNNNTNNNSNGANRPSRCFKCGKTGHMAKECSEQANLCFKCGQPGHVSRECPNASTTNTEQRPPRTNNYNRDSRPPRENSPRDNSNRACFICNQPGHIAKMCPNKKD